MSSKFLWIFLVISSANSQKWNATSEMCPSSPDVTSIPDFTWTIKDIKNGSQFPLLSEVFRLKEYPFGAQAKLTLERNELKISLSYKNLLNESGSGLNVRVIPSVFFTFKDALNRKREAARLTHDLLGYDEFYADQWLLPVEQMVHDDISIDIRVESPAVALQAYSHDGAIACSIDDFREKREQVGNGTVLVYNSPYFYTSPKGYRVKAVFRLVTANGKGLAVEMHFLTGPNDADLQGYFPHTTTVTLFHPNDPTTHVSRSLNVDLGRGGLYLVRVDEQIDNLLLNDTLYYQIKIVPI